MSEWHATDAETVCADLDTSPDGLDESAVADRLSRHGPNELASEQTRPWWRVLIEQFASPLIWLLVAAAAVSFLVGHPVDAVLITVIVAANGVFGFAQEFRAERSIEALRDMASPTVRVRRDGADRRVDAAALVPGDVVLLGQGDVVPADARVLTQTDLEVDESALTGESLPVAKESSPVPADTPLAERTTMLYRGTNVTRGNATAVVVATGMDTEVGAIAEQLAVAADRSTPLQRNLHTLGRRLATGVVVLSLALVPILVWGGADTVQAALTAISLAVAAVPEGLPAVVTLTLALGVRRMADENALVRRLTAVEALGSVDVICTDKTGTLTRGEMQVTRAWVHDETVDLPTDSAVDDDRLDRLFEIGALCNDATAEEENRLNARSSPRQPTTASTWTNAAESDHETASDRSLRPASGWRRSTTTSCTSRARRGRWSSGRRRCSLRTASSH